MRAIHGLTAATESAEAYASLIHPDDRARVDAAMAVGRESGRQFDLQFRIIRPDGALRHVEVFARMHIAADGRPSRAVGIARDITEQVSLALVRQQAQKLESIGQLAAGIAHEINTPAQYVSENLRFVADALEPVTALVTAVQAADGSDEELRRVLVDARRKIVAEHALAEVPPAIAEALQGMERITSIVRAMNSFSHPANDRVPFDLNRGIASTVTVARSEWKYVADVERDFDPELPLVPVMPGEFNQVILNLLVNAAHAIAAGQAPGAVDRGRITISTRCQGNAAEIVVSDNGCGMSPDVQARIFDPFFTTKPVGHGTGQGLALAHAFVARHQGSITVHSAPGQGARFTLRLPLHPATAPPSHTNQPGA
jgi:PAS domain S-box-containing protein